MELYANKKFPENYSDKVLAILRALSMTDMKHLSLHGSSSIRSQLYAADFDAFEKVNTQSIETVASKLKDIMKKVRDIHECYIGDIKCGEVPEWRVFRRTARIENRKIVDFNIKESQALIDKLRTENILSASEAKRYNGILAKATDAWGFLEARKEIRFFVLRWKPQDILNGFLEYRHCRFELEDAIRSGGMIKVDTIANVYDRFTEFSVIYDVFMKGKRITEAPPPVVLSLQEDIMYYDKINPFKALKRMFALAKLNNETKIAGALVDILNGDLGRLYQIVGDLKTLLDLLERPSVPLKEIKAQIDDIKGRVGNIYQLKDFLQQEHSIIGDIEAILKSPLVQMKRKLVRLLATLEGILFKGTIKMTADIDKKL